MVAFVLLASGCQASEPLVPREVYEQVNDDGREWTYDTAWQNIRQLNADIEAGTISTIEPQALFIASQMERLETGKAGAMSSPVYTKLIESEIEKSAQLTKEQNFDELRRHGQALQDSFDDGDFDSAKNHALLVVALARSF